MSDERPPACPVCGEALTLDSEDERWECKGITQHCFRERGHGLSRSLVLVATDSGEDAELFTVYPWPTG
jgi:hypothetical protein